MYVVDASVWVSRFMDTDLYHVFSRAWLGARLASGEWVVAPAVALAEVAGAVARRTGQPQLGKSAATLLQTAPNARLVSIGPELAEQGAVAAADLRLRGADALYVALAQRLGVPLVTWDQEQQERGQRVITVLTPQETIQR